jgi:hypothetical protein
MDNLDVSPRLNTAGRAGLQPHRGRGSLPFLVPHPPVAAAAAWERRGARDPGIAQKDGSGGDDAPALQIGGGE